MKRYLLDSNALKLYVFSDERVHQRVLAVRQAGGEIGTCIPVVAEILGGTEASDTRDRNMPKVERVLKSMKLWPFDLAAAREYSIIFAMLRRKGITMQVIDRMIASIAFALKDCTVVSSDGDLRRVPGLSVEDWSK